MKLLIFIASAALAGFGRTAGQDLSGKWYGKITQGPGGYASEYALELEVAQHNEKISGISYAYYNEDVVARFNYYGFFNGDNRVILQEGRLLEEKTPPHWMVCLKRMALNYRRTDSVEYLEGEWAGIGIEDGQACIPGYVYLSKTPHIIGVPAPSSISRPLTDGKHITVNNPDIIVTITDYRLLDGDTVTVYFNELKIVDHKLIGKEPIVLHLRIDEGQNPARLLLFADNLGRIPPNTALMVVEDSRGLQRIKLESDYERSDVLYVRYRP